jgi:mannose-6-phosphate isomerase-like protein (cupin superfamily)
LVPAVRRPPGGPWLVSTPIDRATGHRVERDEGERLHLSDAEVVIRASAESTGGAFAIVEEVEPLDTPRHVHANEDELFFVLEGEHVFEVGGEEFPTAPGGLVFARTGCRTRSVEWFRARAGS